MSLATNLAFTEASHDDKLAPMPAADDPLAGLPGALPAGETVLWRGRPDFWTLAVDCYRVRAVALYLAAMAVLAASAITASGAPLQNAVLATAIIFVPLSILGLGLLAIGALLAAKTTSYFVTERRVILLIGVAFTKCVNIPLSKIDGVSIRARRRRGDDIALSVRPGQGPGALVLWPHARVTRGLRCQPVLRGLADAKAASATLCDALIRSEGGAMIDAPGGKP
ncbi:photosynthetic complex putative assembly protein PuhB [Acuticoccus sp. MNP-M23]|uniref:photosynthetic complex putative assembly protein PuhB n=1 Tax=Acuticoccus sp. MNP-M23 TaxID=3072793 RepID=UPI0028159EBE|nr:photosynthetic complex putative assembly protein PuhB [Acuticoccus sp. MNP-M23]WMS41909.1 photosynthetic complex putative assembly protein PuhB [Acuticoccus sp. MNP-M23]